MQLTILGSGTNVHPRRAAAGYLLETDQRLIFDLGPRTLSNLIHTGIDRHQLPYLLFSHYHADHFADFITFFFDAVYHAKHVGPRADLTIIGPRGTKALFRSMLNTFPGFRLAPFRVRLREVEHRPFRLGQTVIRPSPVVHSQQLDCLGYRVEYDGRTFVYSGDATASPELVRLCRGADLAVLDCSFPDEHPGPGHMHAGQCGRIAQDAEASRVVLSHFYPIAERYAVRQQAQRRYDGRVLMAKDRLKLEV